MAERWFNHCLFSSQSKCSILRDSIRFIFTASDTRYDHLSLISPVLRRQSGLYWSSDTILIISFRQSAHQSKAILQSYKYFHPIVTTFNHFILLNPFKTTYIVRPVLNCIVGVIRHTSNTSSKTCPSLSKMSADLVEQGNVLQLGAIQTILIWNIASITTV